MFDYIVDHAIKNAWCTPNQDMQAIIQPKKITGLNGVWNMVNVMWRRLKLPLPNARFHVYQLNQLNPTLLGLFSSDNTWSTLASACNSMSVMIDLYDDNGIQLPRTEAWYMFTQDRCLILAIKDQPSIPIDLNVDNIYLRVYTNAYFASTRSDPLVDGIYVEGGTFNNTADILTLQQNYNAAVQKPGIVSSFVNGYKVDKIDLITVKPGDVAEFVYDSSIIRVIDLPVNTLESFNSTLDSKHKYLLHYSGNDNQTIDYYDDLDFFIQKSTGNNRYQSVYYHRNQDDAIRMVTHRDYAMPVAYLVGFVNAQPEWSDPTSVTIRIHVRKSGYQRPLVDETNRIKELYKLPDTQIVQAMIGTNATMINWTASVLENSFYTKLMGANLEEVTQDLVQKAYGYNAIAKLLGNSPLATHLSSELQMIDVPYGLKEHSIVYEYDNNGLLQSWNSHVYGSSYSAYSANITTIEMISGIPDTRLDELYGATGTVTLNPALEYRFYRCPIINGEATNQWEDVTDSGQYGLINNQVTWLINPNNYLTLIRSNLKVLAYSIQLPVNAGVLRFTLNCTQVRNGIELHIALQIPLGELEIVLNKHSLIEDIDYFVDGNQIVIVNKAYLINPLTDKQSIIIRHSGFCKSDLTREKNTDKGFISHGLLSRNNRFDLHDDKVQRIIVGVRVYRKDQMLFSETDSGVTVPNALNGLPYAISDIVVPIRDQLVGDTYVMREQSKIIDKRVSDYLTLKLPEPTFNTPNVIENMYEVVSPFCCKLIYDLQSGVLDDPRLKQNYSDNDVRQICQPYEELLRFDPATPELRLDPNYVIVQPHNLTSVMPLSIYAMKFIKRVVKLYFQDTVDLSHFVSVTAS